MNEGMFPEKTRLVVLDVETTGKERATDQIIELCLRCGLGPDAESRTWRMRPEVPIHPEAVAVHGIAMEDVVNCPCFGAQVPEFLPLIEAADVVVGYNISFDLDMIQAELARVGLPPLGLANKSVVDVLRLWHHVEPRTLVAAHAKFCGEALVNAHQAAEDVAATARVLSSMLSAFGLEAKSWAEIAAIASPFSNRVAWLGPSAHIQWDKSGAVVFGFGKHKGQQVVHADAGFLKWVLAKDFPPHVKKICEVALERRSKFGDWIAAYYPRPSVMSAEPDPATQEDNALAQDSSSAQGVLL